MIQTILVCDIMLDSKKSLFIDLLVTQLIIAALLYFLSTNSFDVVILRVKFKIPAIKQEVVSLYNTF